VCGICGIAFADPARRVDETVVQRMNAALAHRGPDDAGLWHGGHVALAMRRLSILDLPGGRQPMTNEDGSVIVVFNGEIYNFQEIRSDLVNRGHVFRTRGDTEVIVHAYEEYGDDALERFNGMFAFAVYDAKRDRLLLARDRLGIKPLYYCVRNGALAFASELDALVCSGFVDGAINPAALDAYFTFLYVPAPDTIYEGVWKLNPGEKLVFERGNAVAESYWNLTFDINESWTLDSAADRYLDLLTDSVRLQRISDVPLGAFLSGGIDSSSVVGVLSLLNPTPLKTFSIGFEDPQANELSYARIAARYFQTDHTEEVLRPDMVAVAGELIRYFGEPFADSSAVPTWLVSKLARSRVTVALSGDGGDELFAGYTWLHQNRRVAKYRVIPASLRALIDVALRLAPSSPRVTKLRRFSRDSFLDSRASFRRRETCFDASMHAALYRPALAERIRDAAGDRFDALGKIGPASPDDWMLYMDTRMYLPEDILTKVDRMSMAHSLEARVPLLDHRIVEFAATVPFTLKLKRRMSKRLAKHALRDLLPPELLDQRKHGFAIPIHRWFREDLRAYFQEMVLSEGARSKRYLNQDYMRFLFTTHTIRKENYGHHLWALLMFEHWLRYIDRVPGIRIS
jgi:asparagine synthase (glutamine-hydrolysing)